MPEPEPNDRDSDDLDTGDVTRLLTDVSEGRAPAESLLPLVYRALHDLAARRLAGEAAGHTLQPTALVHEAYLRLAGADRDWNGHRHFLAAAARAMRQILVDHARGKRAVKRGGDRRQIPLDAVAAAIEPPDDHVLEVDGALTRLEASDPRKAAIVNLRYFAGLTVAQTADVLDLSVGTVEREWRYIRAWLLRELQGGDG